MIKVENKMLILDSAATKEDVDAINEFVNLAKEEAWQAGYEQGYDTGFDFGLDAEVDEETWESGYDQGHADGIKAEQERIQSVLGMMFESSLNMGQGNKAVQYKHAMDLLKPVEIKPYNPEDDGF